jgi:iron(III) transport system permease protein
MTRWRVLLGILLLLAASVPLLAPVDELRRLPHSWRAWDEAGRLWELLQTSLLLTGVTLAIVLPLGLVGGVLLFRTHLPGRHLWRALAFLSLFIPLPLVTTACQLAFGSVLPATPGSAWSTGLFPAIVMHAILGLPWCIVIIGLGLTWVEPELEEDALTAMPAWQVLLRVTLPRTLPAIALAGLVVALQTWNEIAVTDFVQVRTFAEEVYTQYVGADARERARSTAVALPAVVVSVLITWSLIQYWRRHLPSRQALLLPPRLFELGPWRWPCLLVVITASCLLLGMPLAGLIMKAGLRYGTASSPGPPVWDPLVLMHRVGREFVVQRWLLCWSLLLALATGILTSTTALIACWLSRGSRYFEVLIWVLAAALWAVPGPILGLGLLDTILNLITLPGGGIARLLLYERPSPLPNLWICSIRFFPIALAVLWPLVRMIPRELEEAAMLDGLGPWQRFLRVIVPQLIGPLLWATAAVGVLTLGELSASKLVSTPGFTPLAHHVFQQMHARADAELAALSLVLLSVIVLSGLGMLLVGWGWARRHATKPRVEDWLLSTED